MKEQHPHECEYQFFIEAIARTIAQEIARALPQVSNQEEVRSNGAPSHLQATLTVAQAAEVIGIGRSSAYEAVRTEEIPSIRIGTRIRIPTARLFEYLASGKPWRERRAELLAPPAE
jgi:excisionase family DNA binding protein